MAAFQFVDALFEAADDIEQLCVRGFHRRAARPGELVNGTGIGDGHVLLPGNLRELRERAPLEINHQQHDAQPREAERAGKKQRGLLRLARGIGVNGALVGDGFFERLDAGVQRVGIAACGIERGLLVFFDGQL